MLYPNKRVFDEEYIKWLLRWAAETNATKMVRYYTSPSIESFDDMYHLYKDERQRFYTRPVTLPVGFPQ